MIAIGVGFRTRCTAETLVDLARRALGELGEARADVLATVAEKDRPVLHAAAAILDLPVAVLPKAALAAAGDRITVRSVRAETCLGIPSVAEAAALAAAGPGARLVVTRLQAPDATCAIAASDGP